MPSAELCRCADERRQSVRAWRPDIGEARMKDWLRDNAMLIGVAIGYLMAALTFQLAHALGWL